MSTIAEPATIEDLAAAIDEFSYDYDTYGYNDACDDREVALAEITASIHSGNVVHLEDWLAGIVREKDSNSMRALKLLDCLIVQKQQGFLEQFQNRPDDAYAIFQLKNDEDLHDLRFASLSYAQTSVRTVKRENYNLVYMNQLKAAGSISDKLDVLYYRFNISRPNDFRGHSLSVSDIIALKQNGVVSCHYVDSMGFKELPSFLPSKTPCFHEAENAEGAQKGEPVIDHKPKHHKEAQEIER